MTRIGLALLLGLALSACQSAASELSGLAATPPLDYSVLITGGAFLSAEAGRDGTFFSALSAGPETQRGGEAIRIDDVLALLERGRVFHRIAVDTNPAHRRAVGAQLTANEPEPDLLQFLQRARDDGFDFLLVVDELEDGPIDAQGINARWPVTFATWILLGVGALIPDHTFESRATLRVSLRDLQTGRVLNDPLVLAAGPIDLALTERTDFLGLVMSIVVPPFWIGNDREAVTDSVRAVTKRRLLLSLAHDLKSESVRQRLRERSAAAFSLLDHGSSLELVVDAGESLSALRLRAEPPLPDEITTGVSRELLASVRRDGERFHYRAVLPSAARGRLIQALAATIRGAVASATFAPGAGN